MPLILVRGLKHAINAVADARNIADELTAKVCTVIARQGDEYGRTSATSGGSGSVSPEIRGRNWNPFARKPRVQGTPNATRRANPGLREHLQKIAAEKQWPNDFAAKLRDNLEAMPGSVQTFLANNPTE